MEADFQVKTKKGQQKRVSFFRRKLKIIASELKARISHVNFKFVLYIFINRLEIKPSIYIKADNHSMHC